LVKIIFIRQNAPIFTICKVGTNMAQYRKDKDYYAEGVKNTLADVRRLHERYVNGNRLWYDKDLVAMAIAVQQYKRELKLLKK
jgi:hypothetical protein